MGAQVARMVSGHHAGILEITGRVSDLHFRWAWARSPVEDDAGYASAARGMSIKKVRARRVPAGTSG